MDFGQGGLGRHSRRTCAVLADARAAVLALAEELWTSGTPAELVEFHGELERPRSHAPHAHGPNGPVAVTAPACGHGTMRPRE